MNTVNKFDYDDTVQIFISIDNDEVGKLYKKLQEIDNDIFFNGYVLEMIIQRYIKGKHPHLLKGLNTDSEAGICNFYYKKRSDKGKSEELYNLINSLFENDEIYNYIKSNYAKISEEIDDI